MRRLFGCHAAAFLVLAPAIVLAQPRDVVDTAITSRRFDTFLELLRIADLTFALKGSGPYTVFAPTDDAFAAMGARVEQWKGNKPRLRALLQHHIVRGRYTAQQAVRAKQLRTLGGTVLRFQNVGGRGFVGTARFAIPNVVTSNAVLHGIDGVQVPR